MHGNEGWEPEASHIKKKFEEWHDLKKKGFCMEFAQQEGDKICHLNLTAANKTSLRREGVVILDEDETSEWTKHWQTKENMKQSCVTRTAGVCWNV